MTFPRTEGYRADIEAIKDGRRDNSAQLYFFQSGKFHGESMYLKDPKHGHIMNFVTHLTHGVYLRRYRIDATARLLVYEGLFRD